MDSSDVRCLSECFVKPRVVSKEAKQPFYLTPWDLLLLPYHYMQVGLMFAKPSLGNFQIQDLMRYVMEELKSALSIVLVHFYPLAGRLVTKKDDNPTSYFVFVDCNNSPGAKVIHAAVDMTISDIVSPKYVPLVVRSFFDHDGAVNHDGHSLPLLSVKVNELVDGVFVGVSMNHAVADGSTFWHFADSLCEVIQKQREDGQISNPPVMKRWFPDGYGPLINLPYTHHDEFIRRSKPPQFLERVFNISAESIEKLKARANSEYNSSDEISSFQSLSALVWRSITKARGVPNDQVVVFELAINNRPRLDPPLSPYYFGNAVQNVKAVTTAGELLKRTLGWAAWQLRTAVVNHTDRSVRDYIAGWLRSPSIPQFRETISPHSVIMGSSPRFDIHTSFSIFGKSLTILSGDSQKLDGKVDAFPGSKGGGSIDLTICLQASSMHALESDEEFMAFVSQPNYSTALTRIS